MKKTICMLIGLVLFLGCQNHDTSYQPVPASIDPSDLYITEAQQESYKQRRDRAITAMGSGTIHLWSVEREGHNRHRFRPNNYFYYLTGYDAPGKHSRQP